MFDLLIKNATVVDGTGTPAYLADVGVTADRITGVESLAAGPDGLGLNARKVVDAAGRMLTPGFVDVHGHSDTNVLVNPNAESKLRQGITTEIFGNCGSSAFPLRGECLKEESAELRKLGLEPDWTDAAGYFARVEGAKPAINILTFVGHGNIRASVMGYDDRPPTADEMREMEREVEIAMAEGVAGMTTGLIYSPGMFSTTEEVVALQKVAARRGGIYSSHVRSEGDELLESADEFMAVVNGAECRGQFSHLKASGPRNWGKVQRVIHLIEEANSRGATVRFDKYPYIASSTSLASLLPRWVRDGGREASIGRLADPLLRGRIVTESTAINEGREGWDSVLICEAGVPEYEKYQGRTVGDIARELGAEMGEVFVELLVKSELSTSICNYTMSQDETDLAILHPLGMICTDAACRAPYGALSHDCPHPRSYGTFPKFFRDYVKERSLLTIEEAVRKVTLLPCESFSIPDRGRVATGCFADLLLIDWPAFEDKARFADPHHYATGLDAIVVNGVLTVQDGKHTGGRGGRALRHGA
jgi:N-acyl-D-amino-acid deacylase